MRGVVNSAERVGAEFYQELDLKTYSDFLLVLVGHGQPLIGANWSLYIANWNPCLLYFYK